MSGKKKWSTGKTKDKVDALVSLTAAEEEKFRKEILGLKAITIGILADKMKLNGAVSKRIIAELVGAGKLSLVGASKSLKIYAPIH
ncbi:MAG: 40S ribosomal protein S25 [Amphiamblys sp. WSBS2006]|nr:MAG: 40S ribosomal protein S25 [Amphiamblys sp. WSBS2006]